MGTGLGRKGNFCLDKQFIPWITVNQFAIFVEELASEFRGSFDIVWVFHFDLLKNKKYMSRLNDREWVGHCTVDMSEELQELAIGGVFQSSPDAGIAAVGSAMSLYSRCVPSKNSNFK